jgi:cyclohexyl-isocyanide hydratase
MHRQLAGDDVAQSIQLAWEYNPEPPFAGGHPSRTPNPITEALKIRFFNDAAGQMARAIEGHGPE